MGFLYTFVKNALFHIDVLGLKEQECGHAYTDAAIKWLKEHYQSFLDVAKEFDLSDEVIIATMMAVMEEYSNKRGIHALSDMVQDGKILEGKLWYIDGLWRPDVGPGNINIDTAMELKNKVNPDVLEKINSKAEVNSKFNSKIEMARYLLTSRGTAVIGALEMQRVTSKFLTEEKYKADKMSHIDKLQNMVDIWRQGDGRYARMDKKIRKNNKHKPEHKYNEKPSIPIYNYNAIRDIMQP